MKTEFIGINISLRDIMYTTLQRIKQNYLCVTIMFYEYLNINRLACRTKTRYCCLNYDLPWINLNSHDFKRGNLMVFVVEL